MSERASASGLSFAAGADDAEAHQRVRTLVQAIDDGLFQLDADERIVAVNDAIPDLTGYASETLLGEHVSALFGEDSTTIETELDRLRSGAAERGELLDLAAQTADGPRVPCEVRLSLLEPVGGSGGAVGVVRDTSDRESIESELRRERSLKERIVETSPVGIVVVGADGTIQFANERAEEIYGRSREEIGGFAHDDPRWDLVDGDGDSFAAGEAPFDRVLASEEAIYDQTVGLRRSSGERVWLSVNGAPEWDERGEPAGAVFAFEDVTERRETQRRLEESERRYRTLAEHFPNGAVGVYDHDLRYTLAAGEKVGDPLPSAAEIEGTTMPELYPDHVAEDLESMFRAAIEDGESGSAQTTVAGRHWRAWATPLRDADGEIFAGLSFNQDITEQVRRQRDLERYETIVEAVNDGVYVVDEDGRFQMVNETYAEMLGYSPDELVGTKASELIRGDDVVERVEELHEAAAEGNVEQPSLEGELRTADGEWLPVEATFAPLPEGNDRDWHRVGVVRDVSERRERERAIEESERRYRTLVENFPNGSVALFDEDLRYTAVGGQLFDRLDFDPEDRIGERIPELHPPELLEEIEPSYRAAIDGETSTFEIEYAGRHLHGTALPISDEDGDVFAGMVVIQDETERREYEQRLEESNERLEQFAYAASHDLQEPLRMISSYLQLLERRYADDLDEDGREFLQFAVDGADRMRDMIQGLLAYSRVDTRGDPFEPVDLDDVLRDVLQDLRVRIDETGADIERELLPTVEGDEEQLRQLFQNLLDNAIEYSGDEPPRIDVSAERRRGEWIVSVSDRGIGIDPEDADRVFDVFQSLHSQDEYTGTGIGLALCERIVERHGGEIWVESEPGEGATFSFTLPAASDPET